MSYSLGRKIFECKGCNPPRTIKMLVSGDTMSVKCDECQSSAGIKVSALPAPAPIPEETKDINISASNI